MLMFSKLVENSGYWRINLYDKDVNETALVTNHGLFKYKWMLFGLKNAPTMFQQAVGVILASVEWQRAIVYINDVIIFSKSPEQHLLHIDELILLLRDECTKIKMEKY